MSILRTCLASLMTIFVSMHSVFAQEAPVTPPDTAIELYVDADFTLNAPSAEAIELGIRSALHLSGDRIAGQPVLVIRRDHAGNVRRSHQTLQEAAENPNVLAVFGGLHSPPYLQHGSDVNASGLPLLLPWSASGALTRLSSGDSNFIFRLSVDDTKATKFLITEAVDEGGCKAPALLLLDTGWGHFAHDKMMAELDAKGIRPAHIGFITVGLGRVSAKAIANDVVRSKADCAIMLANAGEGSLITEALAQTATGKLDLYSHWGIASDDFSKSTSVAAREKLHLRVLQTCNVASHASASDRLEEALAAARAVDPSRDLTDLSELPANVGFVHAFDLTRILIAAADQASVDDRWQDGIKSRRVALKAALEGLHTPVDGVMDLYAPPFAPSSAQEPDAHEALGTRHLCFAQFTPDGRLPWSIRTDAQ